MSFPIEIFESVINLLRNDFTSLKACSLVCYNFAALTRKHLFNSIKVDFGDLLDIQRNEQQYSVKDGPSLPPSIQCVLNILDTPMLAFHLRHIRIQNYDERASRGRDLAPPFPAHIALCLILGAIKHLDSFSLCLDRLAYDYDLPNRLCQPAEAELIAMFKRARVSEVNLQFITHLPVERLASECPDIRKLGLMHCGNQSDHHHFMHTQPSQPEGRCSHLKSLVLSSRSIDYYHRLRDTSRKLSTSLDLTRLRELSILGLGEGLMQTADQVWADAGASLEQLSWNMNWMHVLSGNLLGYMGVPDSARELRLRHTLRSLRLSFGFRSFFRELEWIQSALYQSSRITGTSTLEELIIVLSTTSLPGSHTGTTGRQKQLLELDAQLNAAECYPHFCQFALFIHFAPFHETTTASQCAKDGFVSAVKREMPLLSAKGVVMVQWLNVKRGETGLDVALQVLDGQHGYV